MQWIAQLDCKTTFKPTDILKKKVLQKKKTPAKTAQQNVNKNSLSCCLNTDFTVSNPFVLTFVIMPHSDLGQFA